jgi:hypothetical protein
MEVQEKSNGGMVHFPAKAGNQECIFTHWIPAFAGMTILKNTTVSLQLRSQHHQQDHP